MGIVIIVGSSRCNDYGIVSGTVGSGAEVEVPFIVNSLVYDGIDTGVFYRLTILVVARIRSFGVLDVGLAYSHLPCTFYGRAVEIRLGRSIKVSAVIALYIVDGSTVSGGFAGRNELIEVISRQVVARGVKTSGQEGGVASKERLSSLQGVPLAGFDADSFYVYGIGSVEGPETCFSIHGSSCQQKTCGKSGIKMLHGVFDF